MPDIVGADQSRPVAKIQAPGVPVSIISIEGAPSDVTSKLQSAIIAEAQARQMALVQAGQNPRYQLKSYFSVALTERGTALSYVIDVFDDQQRRAQRFEGSQEILKRATDPWQAIDERMITLVAERGMNELAGFLVGQPQAAPAAAPVAEQVAPIQAAPAPAEPPATPAPAPVVVAPPAAPAAPPAVTVTPAPTASGAIPATTTFPPRQ